MITSMITKNNGTQKIMVLIKQSGVLKKNFSAKLTHFLGDQIPRLPLR